MPFGNSPTFFLIFKSLKVTLGKPFYQTTTGMYGKPGYALYLRCVTRLFPDFQILESRTW